MTMQTVSSARTVARINPTFAVDMCRSALPKVFTWALAARRLLGMPPSEGQILLTLENLGAPARFLVL